MIDRIFDFLDEHMGKLFIGAGVLFVAFILFLVGFSAYYAYGTDKYLDIEINHTERVQDGDSSRYLIYTKNHGVLQNTDSLWYWKFRSSDIYNDLVNAKTARCHVYGWRIGFFSSYPDIIDCTVTSRKE